MRSLDGIFGTHRSAICRFRARLPLMRPLNTATDSRHCRQPIVSLLVTGSILTEAIVTPALPRSAVKLPVVWIPES